MIDTAGITFRELDEHDPAGDMEKIFLYGRDRIASALFSEIRTNASFLAEILILSLCGAACSGFFRIFRLRPAVGDGVLRDLHLCADLPGGELFCQHSHRGGDDRGYLGIHESAAPGLLSLQ